MNTCPQEKELAAALAAGRWPQACDAGLREHVAGCASCGELVLVMGALLQARSETVAAARLETPGALWWRAELRRRRNALERVRQPLAMAEKLGLAGVLLAAAFLAVWQRSHLAGWFNWLAGLSQSGAFQLGTLVPLGWPMALAAAGVLISCGWLAVYFASARK